MKRAIALCVVCLAASTARAEVIQGPGDVWFALPMHPGGWEQKRVGTPKAGASVGSVQMAADGKDAPNLTIFVFDVPGTPADVEAALGKHVARDGVEVGGAKVTSAVTGKGKEEQLAVKIGLGPSAKPGTVTLRTSAATLNGKPALIAIVGTSAITNVVVGIPHTDAGRAMFDKIVRDIVIYTRERSVPKAPELAPLQPMVAIADVTATSTRAGKRTDDYGAWRALAGDRAIDLTDWCEGKPDAGTGEGITVTFAAATPIVSVDVAAGPRGTSKLATVALSMDDGADQRLVIGKGWASAAVKRSVTKVKIAIASARPGKGSDTCLAVRFVTEREGKWDLAPMRGLDAAALAALPAALPRIQTALFDDDHSKLEPVVAYPLSVRAADDAKPTVHASTASVAKACAAKAPMGCPGIADGSNAFGAFVVPSVIGPNLVEVVFPAVNFRAASQDLWRLKWLAGAWKLVGIDARARTPGEEGLPPDDE